MKYNSFYDEQNTDSVIQFNNVHSIGTTIVSDIVGVENNYIRDDKSDTELITSKDANVINAIDIDWNGANVDLLGKNTVLNTSGQLLGFYKDSINTSYDLANSAYNLADEVKSQLSSLSGLTQEQIQQINNLLKKNVLTELRHKSGDTDKRTPVLADGTIILQELSYTGYIPVDIKFTNTSVDFGISYNSLKHDETIDIHSQTGEISINEAWLSNYISDKTSGLTSQINIYDSNNSGWWTNNIKFTGYTDDNYIPVHSVINSINNELKLGVNKSDIPSTNYTAGDSYIIINNNEISVNASKLISDNNLATTDYIDEQIQLSYNNTIPSGKINLAGIQNQVVYQTNASTDGTDIYISSDRRLKDNILDITDGEVERLFETESGNMHYFEWKENHKPSFGFIAQELIHFAPETVTQDSEYMQVNYNAALTKTCAALFKKIKQLEERIKILEGES